MQTYLYAKYQHTSVGHFVIRKQNACNQSIVCHSIYQSVSCESVVTKWTPETNYENHIHVHSVTKSINQSTNQTLSESISQQVVSVWLFWWTQWQWSNRASWLIQHWIRPAERHQRQSNSPVDSDWLLLIDCVDELGDNDTLVSVHQNDSISSLSYFVLIMSIL